MELIDKEKVVEEIEERINRDNERAVSYSSNSEHDYLCRVKEAVYKNLLSFLDTLETKEVDLEKEFDNYTKNILACDVQYEPFTHLYNCAKHFFELGINSKK